MRKLNEIENSNCKSKNVSFKWTWGDHDFFESTFRWAEKL